ncbi:MAG TPA: FAD-dependent thymidylate synthase [Candidatus Omnitrophota bacterium]|nr:FAD-dependent thymidylate synthase [Candidatus Omnitrophota bacterium]HPD84708.1 FAD-dependent thymidylate synthase [Candidatus Omnitrophota bacterium]HRZ03566.1 FAD-dependent thymidylate synthase [Candidatus Omnitrophota bacterium]
MKVYLAGYNVDTSVLKELQERGEKRVDVTPEVLSAAYARISRDPRPINELRKDSRGEVERARKSNKTIIFQMGHHSVAEHAVFNLDILGVSRLCMEEVEKFRLCSYTEKSQRYITLDKDFVIPQEIKGTRLENAFIDVIRQQNGAYHKFFAQLKEHVFKKHADLAQDPKNHNLLEGWAKEDARYITALATESQVGMTVNARNFELLLRRFASHPLAEVQALGRMLFEQISEVAPSIVIFHEANDRDAKTYPQLRELAGSITGKSAGKRKGKEVELVEYTQDADTIVAASLLHASTNRSYKECRSIAKKLSLTKKKKLFETALQNMQFYDSMLREFEYANLTFNVVLSAACFGQLKRHRLMTLTTQPYDINLGVTIPDSIKEIGMEAHFKEIIDETNKVYKAIQKEIPLAAPYVLTNAHRRRVLLRLNARELCHVSRLREDAHAQWDIQNVARAMSKEAKRVMPLTCSLVGGKDKYNELYKKMYGHLPKVTQAVLPGARSIK